MMKEKIQKSITKNRVMFIYADRILMKILAFSLGPLLGLIVAAFSNWCVGFLATLIGFFIIFYQPYFSDLCLKNTARALGLTSVLLAEGKVVYQGKNGFYQGKLYLTSNELVFVVNNSVDFKIPLSLIDSISLNQEPVNEIVEVEKYLEYVSSNFNQLGTKLCYLVDETGQLIIRVKNEIIANYYYFQVTNPKYWCCKILFLLESPNNKLKY